LSARFAVYWAPQPDDPLHALGSAWLGRDAETGATLAQPPVPDLADLTTDPRLYGLHATLKPPMRLAGSYEAFREAVAALARSLSPFLLPPLAPEDLEGFLALRETVPCPALHDACDAVVTALDAHRAPLTEAEIARRRPERLTERQREYLHRFGYPYVMEEFRFHVTLTNRLPRERFAGVRAAAQAHLGAAARSERRFGFLAIFGQPAPGTPFLISERFPLTG
jgi:putative phosphonate metabolism protein